MQFPCAHFFLTNPTNTPPGQHRLGKTFSAKNLSGSDSDTTYPVFVFVKWFGMTKLKFIIQIGNIINTLQIQLESIERQHLECYW
jgi:hypothetical protein